MEIKINVKLSRQKDSNYTINVDIDPERVSENKQGIIKPKSEVGGIQRPSAERLKMLKHPELMEEEKDTEEVMSTLDL